MVQESHAGNSPSRTGRVGRKRRGWVGVCGRCVCVSHTTCVVEPSGGGSGREG